LKIYGFAICELEPLNFFADLRCRSCLLTSASVEYMECLHSDPVFVVFYYWFHPAKIIHVKYNLLSYRLMSTLFLYLSFFTGLFYEMSHVKIYCLPSFPVFVVFYY
jgi:hypothetical protein